MNRRAPGVLLVNEGAYILEEGIACAPVDIDMVYITGYGFPPYLGGPMFFADRVGLANVVAVDESASRVAAGRPGVLEAGAAAGQAGGRRARRSTNRSRVLGR